MNDLRVDQDGTVVVLGGSSFFRRVELGDPELEAWVAGHILGADERDAILEGRFPSLSGRFVVLLHYPSRRRVEVHNDRWGALPLYYSQAGGSLLLAPRLRDLRTQEAVDGALDHSALGDVMAFDFPLGGATLLKGALAMEPATCLRVQLTQPVEVEATRTWSPVEIWEQEPVALEDAASDLESAFLEGCERATAGVHEVGITLSGGMDSRCLLAAALQLGKRVTTFHTSVPGGRADQYAASMAKMFGVTHKPFYADSSFGKSYYELIRTLTRRNEGMSFEPEAEVCWLRNQVPEGLTMLHGGYAELSKLGDLRRFRVDGTLARASRADFAEQLWRRFESDFETRLQAFTPKLRAELRPRPRQRLLDRIASMGRDLDLSNEQLLQLCYVQEQVKIEKYSGWLWSERAPTWFPFSDPGYVDLLLQVRVSDRIRQGFQLGFLRRHCPELANFPDANTGLRADRPAPLVFLVKVIDRLQRELLGRRAFQDHGDVLAWQGFVDPPLQDVLLREVDERLYDRPGLERLLGSMGSDRGAVDAFQAILLLESWREFMGLRGALT